MQTYFNLKEKYNCNVRFKSTKDDKITKIHRLSDVQRQSAKEVLKQAVTMNLTRVIVSGFDKDGKPYNSSSDMLISEHCLLADNAYKHFSK